MLRAVVVLLAFAVVQASAQPLGLLLPTGKADVKAKRAAPEETDAQAAARLRKSIDELGTTPPAPDGITEREASAARDARAELAIIYERELRSIDEIAQARAARARAESAEREWTQFDQPPPYSILMVDDLRDAADNARMRIASLESVAGHLHDEQERVQSEAKRAQEAVRRAGEAYEAAGTEAARARAAWRREAAQVDVRKGAAWLALSHAIDSRQDEELAMQRAGLRLLERQIELAARHSSFTDADLQKARQRYVDVAAARGRELGSLRAEGAQLRKRRDQVAGNLALLKASDKASADEIAVTEASLRATEAQLAASRLQSEVLQGQITLAEETANVLVQRHAALNAAEADVRRAALERMARVRANLGRWLAFLRTRLVDSRATLRDAEARLARASDLAPRTVDQERDSVVAARRTVAATDGMLESLDRTIGRLDSWLGEVRALESSRGFSTRIADLWSGLREVVRHVWNFELFAVEDTVVADGQTLTTSRGVTVGKSVGAIALFLIGLAVSVLLARRLSNRAVAAGLDARSVRTVRRWTLSLIGVLLALLTLNVARIPITVFAFLGGALAIGVGFGMQTMFKNFISGMILLLERNVQIGDIVEVEGTSGTVVSVDLRSSTVLGFDGVETIVPNSVLLENKVTNWTHSDRRVRRTVRVGVAYGSAVRAVADILTDCAKRHGLVLDDPEPQVLFEDFGADALQFALNVWIELSPKVSTLVVLSDLRFMIEKQLREAGIVIAFPQRDVHLDSARPLKIELVRGGREGAPG